MKDRDIAQKYFNWKAKHRGIVISASEVYEAGFKEGYETAKGEKEDGHDRQDETDGSSLLRPSD